MPRIVRLKLPVLAVDRRNVYAVGGSMGGQEILLLLARHPHLLAGAAVFDAVTDFALQYREFPHLGCDKRCLAQLSGGIGAVLQGMARREVGGSRARAPVAAYRGFWRHSAEMRADPRLPLALANFGLLPRLLPTRDAYLERAVHVFAAPEPPGPPQPRDAVDGEAWPPDRH